MITEKDNTSKPPKQNVPCITECFWKKGTQYHICGVQNEEKGEDSKDRILFIAWVDVTCLVQSNIFRDYLQFTNVGDILKNDKLSIEWGFEGFWLNPFVSLVGHSDRVVCSEIKVAEQVDVWSDVETTNKNFRWKSLILSYLCPCLPHKE